MFEWLKPSPARPVLDADYVDRLAGHLGRAVLNELMADGLIELADRLRRVEEAAAAADLAALGRLGHDLVGMAGHLGLSQLSAAAADLSRSAKDSQAGTVEKASVLCAVGWEAAEALRQHLGLQPDPR